MRERERGKRERGEGGRGSEGRGSEGRGRGVRQKDNHYPLSHCHSLTLPSSLSLSLPHFLPHPSLTSSPLPILLPTHYYPLTLTVQAYAGELKYGNISITKYSSSGM